jgi:hypothetical protein
MSEKKDKTAERVAALEKELAELKAAMPKPIDWEAERKKDAEWEAEKRAREDARWALAMPPSVVRHFADGVTAADLQGIRQAAHAPTAPVSMAPSNQPVVPDVPRNPPGSGTGWAREIPLGPSMHQRYVDQQIDAADAKDQIELAQRIAEQKAALGEK